MDLKNKGLTMEIIADALERCRVARLEILEGVMLPCIAEPRADVSEFAPKMISLKIPVEKIREVIGSGGKTINGIIAQTGVKIDIEDDGTVSIASPDEAAAQEAKKIIDSIVKEIEVGEVYLGTVVNIQTFGAFINLTPGKDGLLHISRMDKKRVAKVEDVMNLGDKVLVRVIEIDPKTGKISLDRKGLLPGDEKKDQ